jgi:hypothetical protein
MRERVEEKRTADLISVHCNVSSCQGISKRQNEGIYIK